MCGRFTQLYSWSDLAALYRLAGQAPMNLEPRRNISPTQSVDVVVAGGESHSVERMRWWLVPNWWKKPLKEVPSAFNARSETVAEKPMFRSAFKRSRCLIPASGFYEWTGPKTDRQPWYITAADGGILTFAGLWERWKNPEDGQDINSCTIIVTAANQWMGALHNRMPVVLTPDKFDAWLNEPREDLLVPAPEDALRAWKVTKGVNSNRYHEADATSSIDAG